MWCGSSSSQLHFSSSFTAPAMLFSSGSVKISGAILLQSLCTQSLCLWCSTSRHPCGHLSYSLHLILSQLKGHLVKVDLAGHALQKNFPTVTLSGYLTLFFLLTMFTITWRSSRMSTMWVQATSTPRENGTSDFSILSQWKPGHGFPYLWQVYYQPWSSLMGTMKAPVHFLIFLALTASWLGMANGISHLQGKWDGEMRTVNVTGSQRTGTQNASETSLEKLSPGYQLLRIGFMVITAVLPHHN